MTSVFVRQDAPPSPPEEVEEATVKVHALQAGHFTLPERFFVHPASEVGRRTVPSLAFLIEHQNAGSDKITRIVFDLGLRRRAENYAEPIQQHIESRQPMNTVPDVTESLKAGGITPDDVDYVIYSHIHWDHVGEPRDFARSTFVVGNGALALIDGAANSPRGSHSFFESDLLPRSRTIELSSPSASPTYSSSKHVYTQKVVAPRFGQSWKSYGSLPRVLDLFNDGSIYIVDAPGHLPGHINILARTSQTQRVYLAGDACHDRRIMRKEKEIGEWQDTEGNICCIHADRKQAEETIERVRQLELEGVEVIFAHDFEWEENPANRNRFFGASKGSRA